MIFQNGNDFLNSCSGGRILCLDVGRVRIGVAVTDSSKKLSLPSDTIKRQGNKKDFLVLKKNYR